MQDQRTEITEDNLLPLRLDGHPLERYVEDFLELSLQVRWSNKTLNAWDWMIR